VITAKRRYYQNKLSEFKEDSKDTWKTLNSLIGKPSENTD
jgi:hypothetical protein